MSPKLPVLKASELIKILERNGFEKISQRRSHIKMRSSNDITIVIPSHSGKNIKPGLLLSILNKAGIDISGLRR